MEVSEVVESIMAKERGIKEKLEAMESAVASTYIQYAKIFPGEYKYDYHGVEFSINAEWLIDPSKTALKYKYREMGTFPVETTLKPNEKKTERLGSWSNSTFQKYFAAMKTVRYDMENRLLGEERRLKMQEGFFR